MSNFVHRALTGAAILLIATQPALSQSGDAELDEVIILSSPLKKSADEIISQTHVILDDDINKNVGTTLGDIVNGDIVVATRGEHGGECISALLAPRVAGNDYLGRARGVVGGG